MSAEGTDVADEFDGRRLDRQLWLPHYLPAWSSRADSAARYVLRDSCLQLFIAPDQGLWCADDHDPPTRVSGIQSGNFSGPVGSTTGQQPYREGLVVREAQETFWGWTPAGGHLEIRARGVLTPQSMVACWLVGLEDRPERSAEICVFEIFGDAVRPGSAAVGMGLHPFRDPEVAEDFEAVRLPIDPAQFHTYGVDWTPDVARFTVDGALVRSCLRPPAYPMQIMLAVFDFPAPVAGGGGGRADDGAGDVVPALVVDHVRGRAPAAAS